MRALPFALAVAGLLLLPTPSGAQNDVTGQMKWSPERADWPTIEQTSTYGDQIRRSLEKIKLPAGFKISLFAIAPHASHMAVSPQGIAVFVGTRKSDVWVITDRNKDRVADEVKSFAPAIAFQSPTGVCFSSDGFLYIVEQNRVQIFPAAEYSYESAGGPVAEIVPQGKLIPPDEESTNNAARGCHVGPDNKLYISLGQPFDVPPEKADLYEQWGIGAIIRMDRDGWKREVLAPSVGDSGQDTGEHILHATNPGTLIYTGTMFPEKYRGIFSAKQTRVMFTPKNAAGKAGKIEPFAEGWHQASGDTGHLVDIAQLHDGSIIVSDELAGAIYRISFGD
jgi:glucose/arabinose dehydrogenase